MFSTTLCTVGQNAVHRRLEDLPMAWPIVCDTWPESPNPAKCSYCGKETRHPCTSLNAKWCKCYAPNAIVAFGLSIDEIQKQKNTQA